MFTAIAALFSASSSFAQDRWAKVEVSSQAVSGSVHMLTGSGGNIGISADDDGILIIDDQYAPLAEKLPRLLVIFQINRLSI